MTILFLSRLFYPHIGGVEKHVLQISKELLKKGHSVIVVAEQHEKSLKDQEKYSGIEIYRIPIKSQNWFKKFFIWKWMFSHQKLIRNADIIHCHDVFFWYLPFRFLYPMKKVFTTFHGYETEFPPSKKAIIVRKISEKLSNGNIIVGEYIKKWYGTKTRFITYGGVESSKLKVKSEKFDKILKILLIGRLENDIGIPIYLQALDELKKRGIKYSFEACGDGSLKNIIQKYGKVHGFVKKLSDYIQKADIVFCSSYLTILNVLNEKRPIFSVYTSFLKEDYLKQTPFAKFIIIENSSKSLADKIIQYSDTNEMNEKINKAYYWVKSQTWDNIANMYLKLWNI